MIRAGSEYSTEMVSPKLSYGEMGAAGSSAVFEASWGKGKCVLRAARPRGCLQSYGKEPKKCHDDYVFERGYSV